MKITQEQLKKRLSYNQESGEFTWLNRPRSCFKSEGSFKSWNTKNAGSTPIENERGYVTITLTLNGCKKKYQGHRLAFLYVYGYMPDNIDHINHQRNDNRIVNLRSATHSENSKNKTKRKSNTSGTTGVFWDKSRSQWKAAIGVNGKLINLGQSKDIGVVIALRKSAEVDYGFHKNHGN